MLPRWWIPPGVETSLFPVTHPPGEITVFFVIVRWKPFLFPFLNVTGFSADSHRSTSLKCEVLIGNGSLWTSQSPRHIDIQWHLHFNEFFFFFFFHPIFIRAWFLPPIKYVVTFLDIFDFANCNYFCHPFVSRCKGNGLKLSRTSGAAEQSGKLEWDIFIIWLNLKKKKLEVASVTNRPTAWLIHHSSHRLQQHCPEIHRYHIEYSGPCGENAAPFSQYYWRWMQRRVKSRILAMFLRVTTRCPLLKWTKCQRSLAVPEQSSCRICGPSCFFTTGTSIDGHTISSSTAWKHPVHVALFLLHLMLLCSYTTKIILDV